MMAPHVYGRFVYLSPIVFICGLLVRLLDSVAPLFFSSWTEQTVLSSAKWP